MKNSKSDETQINISVVGLSGSENVKGITGVGKSCLCNRLAQPNFYKHKHVSTISSIDFYGSTFNQSHWLYWSHINKEIRGKRYRFHFIEQTFFIDDNSFREFKTQIEPQDYVKRATMTELRVNKKAYTSNMKSVKDEHFSLNFEEKLTIHLFILVFDVSDVDKRNSKNQEVIFKQLFDSLITTKKPMIIVTTKNDIMSQSILDKLKAIVEKRPYNKYPIVETSAKLDINISHIYEISVSMLDNGMKNARQISYNYSDGFLNHLREDEECKRQFVKIIEQTLIDDNIFMPWDQFMKMDNLTFYLRRFSGDILWPLFMKKQQDVLLDRRASNNRRSKDILLSLLQEFDHLIPIDVASTEEIITNLKNDNAFISHFINFDRDMECFKFDEISISGKLLPFCLLDPQYENNLLFFIEEYVIQKSLEYRLYYHLLENGQKYFRKSLKEIRDDLIKSNKHFIQDKVIKNVYEKFRNYYFSFLHSKFLDFLHENPDPILSQTILKFIDIVPHKSWTINGITAKVTSSLNKSFNERKIDDNSFLFKMIKEINKQLNFDDFPISQDENNTREDWIREYLTFLSSKDMSGCIIEDVTKEPCVNTIINNVLRKNYFPIKFDENVDNSHMFYMAILGNSTSKANFRNSILSRSINLPLKICKIHSSKYTIDVVQDLDTLNGIFSGLTSTNDRCSILCAVILVDAIDEMESLVNELEHFLSNVDSNLLLTKFIVCNIDCSKDNDYLSNQCIDLVERMKYTIIPWNCDNQHKTIDFIVSNAQKLSEQIIVWVVMVCGDCYDHEHVVKFLMETINNVLLPCQSSTLHPMAISGSTNEMIMQNYRLVFISYHQVMKLMFQSSSLQTVDAMILVCSLNRTASFNTCLAIKKYLPADITSSCHFMLLGIGEETNPNCEQFVNKSVKCGMEYGSYDIEADDNECNEDIKNRLLCFFKGIITDTSTLESFNSITSNSSSLMNTNKPNDSLIRYLNKTMCQLCSDSYRSDINVYTNSSSAKLQDNSIIETGSYDLVLGETNQNGYNFYSPEFIFDGAQDSCRDRTEVKCSMHLSLEQQNLSGKSFRTRIRSQSGPDLRIPMDFNQNSTQKYETIFYCSICSQDINKTQLSPSSRQSFRLVRQTDTKETTQKTFTAKLHDLFNPIKKLSETQLSENRKISLRSFSKRPK